MPRDHDRRFTSRGERALLCGALAIGALLAAPARADVLHLEGGRRLVGRIVSRDAGSVTIRAYGGDVRVLRAEIVRIEGDAPPVDLEALVRTNRRSLRPGDSDGALRLADLAREHGLAEEEGRLLQLAVAWRPESRELRTRLGAWQRSSRRLPASAAAVARLRREFAAPCEVHRTRRFAIAHDVTPATAERVGADLERTWGRLHDLAERLGIELRAPESALPVHVRAGHSHWGGLLEVVDELFDADERLRAGPAPIVASDGSVHPEECEPVAALRRVEEVLERRRGALARGVEELRQLRATAQATRSTGEKLWVSRSSRGADLARALLDEDRASRTALDEAVVKTGRLLAELPRVHAGAADALLESAPWNVLRHESVSGERLASRLEGLESVLLRRFDEGRALGADELDDLDRRLTAILALAVPQRLMLRDRQRAAVDLQRAVTAGVVASDRVRLTRAAARSLAAATDLLAEDAPTWVAEGVASLLESADGETDALGADADEAGRALAAAWGPTAARAASSEVAALLDGEAFRQDFARARVDAGHLLRVLIERAPADAGRYLADLRAGRVAGDDAEAFTRRFGPAEDLLPAAHGSD